jgi:hypothetical protein
MRDEWSGRPFPAFELEAIGGRRWTQHDLLGCRAVIFCFASW